MLEMEYSRVLCSPLSRVVPPGSKVDIYNRLGSKYTGERVSCVRNMPASVRKKAMYCLGYTYRSLEATVEFGEEWVVPCQGKDAFLGHGAFNIVILENDVLLQHLHCIELPTLFHLGKHHLNQRER